MPLSNLLKSAAGTCPFCNQKAGILSREHPRCRRTFQVGWDEMVELALDAAKSREFHANSLRVALAEIARRSYGDASTVSRALDEGWRRAVRKAAADGSITHEEEFRLRVQPIVQNLMKSLLEDHPSLLTETDIANLMDREYTQTILGLRLAGFPLLRRREAGRRGSDSDGQSRFYAKLYAGRFYVCSQWWKDHHLVNAKGLLRFVGELAGRDPDHLGIPVLERHMRALEEYIDRNA